MVGKMTGKSKKAGWPKVQEVHSPENRTGQAWKAKEGLACVLIWDRKCDPPKFKCGDEVKVNQGPVLCKCGGVIRIDTRGYAACEGCGEIYNANIGENLYQMSNRAKKRLNEKLIYDCLHNRETTPL